MKTLLTLIVLSTLSTASFAHDGSHTLICKTINNSHADQSLEIYLKRPNSAQGYAAPEISVTINKKRFILKTPSDLKSYGKTFHNSPLKVITVNVDVPYAQNIISAEFDVTAVPSSVKAYDYENKPIQWSIESEKDECHDSTGRATYQGILHGYLNNKGDMIKLETQILDCELTYNSGMAC